MQGASGVTVMAWVSPSEQLTCPTPGQGLTIAGRGWDYSQGIGCFGPAPVASPKEEVRVAGTIENGGGWGYPGGAGGVPPNQWMHVAFTWDHEYLRLFVNGKHVYSRGKSGQFGNYEPTFAVGCMVAWYFTENQRTQQFKGTIDEVMLYRRALSPAEVGAYYTASDPCTHPVLADGTTCNDSNLCTQTDTCQAGTCMGGNPKTCTASDQCHTPGVCNPANGVCGTSPAKPDGATCDDGAACTQSETCATGACEDTSPYPTVVNLPVQDLGSLGLIQSFANDINSSGTVVGWSSTNDVWTSHAWVHSGSGPLVSLTEVGAGPPSSADAINDAGTIAGYHTVEGVRHPFRYTVANGFEDLGTYGDASNVLEAGQWIRGARASDVNNAGQVVGYYTLGNAFQGFRYSGGVYEEIGSLAGGTTVAGAISDSGRVVGYSLTVAGEPNSAHAIIYDNAEVGIVDLNTQIDPMAGWTLTNATDINGEFIVGSGIHNGLDRAFRLRLPAGGGAAVIDEISGGWHFGPFPASVNAAGDVVGGGYRTPENAAISLWSAFVYTDLLGFKNLDDLIPHDFMWTWRVAHAINAAGEIVGWGYHTGMQGPRPFRIKLPTGQSASCQARNMCGGGDGDPICLYSDGVVETSPGHFVAVFGFDNASSTSVQPNVNEVRLDGTVVANPQPRPPAHLPPGTHTGGYLPTFDAGHTISWTVNGETVTASASSPHLTPVQIGGNGVGVVLGGRTIVIKADTSSYSTPPATEPTVQGEPQMGEPFNGALAGSLGVGPSGAATYAVPIAVPPGIGGMAPNLSLVYNSQAGLGLAGQGWELAGLSIVHRCPRTRVQDGFGHQVSMDPGDKDEGVCLDGKRLIEQVTSPGTYKFEQDDHSTITRVPDGAADPDQPLKDVWFKVVTKTGETRYYGKSARTRVVLQGSPAAAAWAFERAMDSWGNYFDVHYNADTTNFSNDGLYVTSIDYTGHVPTASSGSSGAKDPFAHVTFDYDPRREIRSTRFGSVTLPKRVRLKRITTSVDINNANTVAGRYYLTYAADYRRGVPYSANNDAMLPTRLTTIDYCAGQTCPDAPPATLPEKRLQGFLEPLQFEWEGGGYHWDPAPAYAPPEAIERRPDNDDNEPTSHGTAFVDLDGDGRVDFLRSFGGSNVQDAITQSHVWRNSGHGWEPKDEWALPVALVHNDGTSTGAVFADMNGDGLPDLVSRELIPCPNGGPFPLVCSSKIMVRLNNIRAGGAPWQVATGFSTIPGTWRGDEIDFIYPDRIADMNGDGKADLVRFGPNDSDLQVRYTNSTGTGWEVPIENFSVASILRLGSIPISRMRLEDINRDGLPDLVAGSQSSFCHAGAYGLNMGRNTFQTVRNEQFLSVWKALLPADCIHETTGTPPDKRIVGDVDGDGFRDVMSSFRTRIDNNLQQPGNCVLNQCSCPAACQPNICTGIGAGQTCQCSCPSGITVTDSPNLRFTTGMGWTQSNVNSFLDSLLPFRPHPNDNPILPSARPDFIFAMADLNADGLADFVLNHVHTQTPEGRGQLLVNNGASFDDLEGGTAWQSAVGIIDVRLTPRVPTEDKDFPAEGVAFVDLDGDGVTDLVQGKGNVARNAWLNRYRPPVIKRFPNGLARPSEVTYSVITTEEAKTAGTYRDTATAPEAGTTFFITPVRVVESVSAEDGTATGTMFTTTYVYDRMRGSAYGRGPQGFSQVTAIDGRRVSDTDSDSRKVTETTYAQFFPYTGMPLSVSRYIALGGLSGTRVDLNVTQTKYCDKLIPTACSDALTPYPKETSRFVYPQTITDTSYLYDGEIASRVSTHNLVRTTTYWYDTYGNPTSTTVATEIRNPACTPGGDCARHVKTVQNHYDPTPNWNGPTAAVLSRLGKPTRVVVTSTSNVSTDEDGLTHTTAFDYLTETSYPPGDSSIGAIFLRRKRVEPGAGTPIEEHTVYTYDDFGNVTRTTACGTDLSGLCLAPPVPSGPSRTTSVSYNAGDFAPPPGGRVTSLGYADGRFPVMTTNALGQKEYTAYDPIHGGLLQKTGPNGIHTCMTYDPSGRPTTQTGRCGTGQEQTTATSYFFAAPADPFEAKVATRIRVPTGVASWAYTDVLGRATFARGRTFEGGFSESFTRFDRWGRTAQQSTPRTSGSTEQVSRTITTYDEADRVRKISRDLGDIDGTGVPRRAIQTLSYFQTTVRTEHNVDGDDEAHLHQQPREETKGVFGKVSFVVDAKGTRLSFLYDADGNLTDTVDGPNTTHFEYFPNGQRKRVRDPDLGEWQYTYNAFGEIETQIDANGTTISTAYDKVGRMTSKTSQKLGQPSVDARWVYDVAPGAGIGKLAAMVGEPADRLRTCAAPHGLPTGEKRAVRSFTYTAFGEVESATDCTDGDTFVTNHTYDGFGRPSVATYPLVDGSPLAVRYNYTSLGFLYYVSDATDGSLYWAATARDAAGQVKSEYTRNGVETTSTRNEATGWLMGSRSVAHADGDTLIQNWTYRFDEVGNLRSRTRADVVNGAPSDEAFSYDPLNRLTGSAVAVGSGNYFETYDIDVRGNITAKAGKGYTYGAAGGCATGGPHAVCTFDGSAQYQYDANGNLLSGSGRSITYDLANKAVHIQSGDNGVDFVYGADGNRVVQETTGGGSTARTVYVGLGATGKSMYERTTRSDGTVEHTHFLYAPGEHKDNAFAIKVVRGGSATLSFNHFDHLGSVTAVSDEQGHVVSAASGGGAATVAEYDPWGARRSPDGRPAEAASFQPLPGHREFTGHETVPGVGLVNMNGRIYDPAIGRFLSPDPNVQYVADLQSYNRYSYVLNNPLRYTDPTGYFLDSAGELFGYIAGIAAVSVCAVASGGACAIAYIGLIAYSSTTMALNGASFDQIVEMQGVSILAGLAGGAAVGAALGPTASIGAKMVGGAVSSILSTAITTVLAGRDLGGEELLVSAINGAVSAGLAAALRQTNPVSQKTFLEQKGRIQQLLDSATALDSIGDRAGATALRNMAVFNTVDALGLRVPRGWSVTYDRAVGGSGDTIFGRVRVGDRGLTFRGANSASWLASTLIHEFVHVHQFLTGQYSTFGHVGPGNTDFVVDVRNEIPAFQAEVDAAHITGIDADQIRVLKTMVSLVTMNYLYADDLLDYFRHAPVHRDLRFEGLF